MDSGHTIVGPDHGPAWLLIGLCVLTDVVAELGARTTLARLSDDAMEATICRSER